LDTWDKKNGDTLPPALRVRWRAGEGIQRELLLPLPIGQTSTGTQSGQQIIPAAGQATASTPAGSGQTN